MQNRTRLAVAGENVIDLVPYGDEPGVYRALTGGSPANTAVAAQRLGSPTALLARISTDTFGEQVRARLATDGVDDRYLVVAPEPSSLAVVSFDATGSAHYDFWLTGTADWEWRDAELPDPLEGDVAGLHVGSIAAQREPGASALLRLARRERERGAVTISLDPNVRPPVIGGLAGARSRLEELAGLAHVVKVSDEDLEHLYPGTAPLEAARRWLDLGPALVTVTHGAAGAHALTKSAEVAQPAPEVRLADTVGAGDAFMGALLHAMNTGGMLGGHRHHQLADAGSTALRQLLHTATHAAALTCGREGADPPTMDELTNAAASHHTLNG